MQHQLAACIYSPHALLFDAYFGLTMKLVSSSEISPIGATLDAKFI